MRLLLICGLCPLSGCSFVFAYGPPEGGYRDEAHYREQPCRSAYVAPAFDGFFATGTVVLTGLAVDSQERNEPGPTADTSSESISPVGPMLTIAAVYVVSAIHGILTVGECRDAIEAMRARGGTAGESGHD